MAKSNQNNRNIDTLEQKVNSVQEVDNNVVSNDTIVASTETTTISEEINNQVVKQKVVKEQEQEVVKEQKPVTDSVITNTTSTSTPNNEAQVEAILSSRNKDNITLELLELKSIYGDITRTIMMSINTLSSPPININPATAVSEQHKLYHIITEALNTEDYIRFKTRFDIVNRLFKDYSNVLNDNVLLRHSEHWRYGQQKRKLYNFLVVILEELCDVSNRKNNLKKIDFNKLFSHKELPITQTMKTNLTKYYELS